MSKIVENTRTLLQGNLGVMVLSSGLWNLGGNMIWPFYSLYVLELGGSYIDVGLVTALGSMIQVIPTFIGGYLSDRIGRKKIVYTMSFLIAFSEVINAFVPNYRFLFITSAVGAIWMGLREPSFTSIIADSTTGENRALGYALWLTAPRMFGVASPYIIGVLIDGVGVIQALRWGYLGLFLCALLSSTIRYRNLKETLDESKKTNKVSIRSGRELLSDFQDMFRNLPKELWIFLSIDLAFTLGWGLCEPYFVTYAKDTAGLSGSQWGFVASMVTLLNMVLMLLTAQASDSHGRVKFIFSCMFLWSVTFFLYILTGNFIQVLIIRIAIAISSSIGSPAWEALFMDYSPREYRGRFNAVAIIAWSTCWSFGNILGGYLYQHFNSRAPFQLTSLIMLIASILAVIYVREPTKRED